MQLSFFRSGPLAEALRAWLVDEPPVPDGPAVLADLIDLRGGVELAERLDAGLAVPPPAPLAERRAVAAVCRARVADELSHVQGRLDEAFSQAFRPRYRLPTAHRAFEVLGQADALTVRKGAPLKTGLRTVLAPFHEFLETHGKRARFALRALRAEVAAPLASLGGEAAALAELEAALSQAMHARAEVLTRRIHRAAEVVLADALTAAVKALPVPPTPEALAPAFHPDGGAFCRAFAEARGLHRALFLHERRWLEGLVEAACAAAEAAP
ncbi:MAG: hypothetical protein R3F60_06890 [bacterium]